MIQKANFITFIGAPNAGKSTLLNRLMGQKISIVTHKAQTTRNSIKGIKNIDNTQLIFIDTPGLFDAKTYTDKLLVECAWQMTSGTDLICLLVDANHALNERNKNLIAKLKSEDVSVVLVINKIDQIKRLKLLEISRELNQLYNFVETFMISALDGSGVKDLQEYFIKNAIVQPWPFDDSEITTAPLKFNVSEIVREKLLIYTNQEIPYTSTIEVEHWETKDKVERIMILMKVKNKNHKKIILGSQGGLVKKIGTKARIDIEKFLGKKVFLQIHIKVTDIDKMEQPESY